MNSVAMLENPADICFEKIRWQPVLFAQKLSRLALLSLKPRWPCANVSVRVYRNYAFELVAGSIGPFMAYYERRPVFSYSDYDDSLSFADFAPADVAVVALNFERFRARFAPEALAAWLAGRLQALRDLGQPVVQVHNWDAHDGAAAAFNRALAAHVAAMPGVHLCDLQAVAAAVGDGYVERKQDLTGTHISAQGGLEAARWFGLRWLAASAAPLVKAVVVDLDNTLYQGVLGEDGVQGVALTPGHARLQQRLAALSADGIFVGMASRNEAEDVTQLFAGRADFPLQAAHISARVVNWQPKSDNLALIAAQLRIGLDSIVFVDDNPGELAEVCTRHPQLRAIHAGNDGADTAAALDWYPGLFRWNVSDEDRLRVQDLKAAGQRAALGAAAGADHGSYVRSLNTVLRVALNRPADVARLAELSVKTNQFNLNLLRLGAADVQRYQERGATVSVGMADNISDSGMIASLLFSFEDDAVVLDEACISCRALGRGLENLMLIAALRAVAGARAFTQVRFRYATGPRNGPARKWLEDLAGAALDEQGSLAIPLDTLLALDNAEALNVRIDYFGTQP
ncbi:HAD-IIIC family phosphatase [uncultured Massilia sp.]|uniref:HAD-IIIC family phosphatase n=1 Tax=uncultured Massilia sp. TaxID=169973 RepID=UPI0025E55F76|nr:HAD-IIIC family phosphatase [uncultured Massilia sp.]